jgi:hypothetical protein
VTSVIDLRAALAGELGAWRWEPGLDPAATAAALGIAISPGRIAYAGKARLAATLAVPGLAWPVWAAWETSGELLLIEVLEPPAPPSEAAAIAAFGEPEARLPRGRGPHPSYEQQAWLSLGFTLFTWAGGPPASLWLYRPTDLDHYIEDLGARVSPTRARR